MKDRYAALVMVAIDYPDFQNYYPLKVFTGKGCGKRACDWTDELLKDPKNNTKRFSVDSIDWVEC